MSGHKTEAEILSLAEETYGKLRTSSLCDDDAISIIESALRSITPPQEPVDRGALGKLMAALFTSAVLDEPMTEEKKDEFWNDTPKSEQSRICTAATQFALSIQKKVGVCVWEFSKNQYTSGCVEGRGVATQLSPAAMCWEFCPFCSNKIQEQGGGK